MFAEENTSRITLLISISIHLVILAGFSIIKLTPYNRNFTGLEISYVSSKEIAKFARDSQDGKRQIRQQKELGLPKNTLEKKLSDITLPKKVAIPNMIKPSQTFALSKPQALSELKKIKKITLKNFAEETSKDPVYLSYRGKIRKKIQDSVYFYSEQYSYFENPQEGKIFVSFTIDSKGMLQNIEIYDERSSPIELLKKIVQTAINAASPFETFPPELKFDQRTFNLEISFEIE